MLYEFKLNHNAVEATKNICFVKYEGTIDHCICCNQIKGYWMRNNQNGGWKWNGNLYSINKIQYSPAAWKKYSLLMVTN